MPLVEVSRTLVKSAPELWAELGSERLSRAVGEASVEATDPERELAWTAAESCGTARLEPAGWGTRVTLTAEVAEPLAGRFLGRLRARHPEAAPQSRLRERLDELLDELGADHRRPFARNGDA